MTGALASPATTVGTAFQLGVVAVGVAGTDVGADGRVAGGQCLGRTGARPDHVDLVEEVTAFTARRHVARLLSTTSTPSICSLNTPCLSFLYHYLLLIDFSAEL